MAQLWRALRTGASSKVDARARALRGMWTGALEIGSRTPTGKPSIEYLSPINYELKHRKAA